MRMGFKCLDCGNQSSKFFTNGRCPACDSRNVCSDKLKAEDSQAPPKASTFQRVCLVLLWGGVIYGVWENYIR